MAEAAVRNEQVAKRKRKGMSDVRRDEAENEWRQATANVGRGSDDEQRKESDAGNAGARMAQGMARRRLGSNILPQ